MNYLSFAFAGFVLLLLIAYYLVPQKGRWSVLLCGSLFFYASFDIRYIPFLLFTALTTFFSAKLLMTEKKKRLILITCVVCNVLVWFAVKDLVWAIESLQPVFPNLKSIWQFSVLVPVGISYYMLQALGYLIDVYRGKCDVQGNFAKYLLFLSWFPAIVQGPISRYADLMPQLLQGNTNCFEKVRSCLVLTLVGIVKKMVIADRIGMFVNVCFSQFEELKGIVLYAGAVAYAIQLYMDFSGCVDICRGISGMFGVELISNFNRPYLSNSIKEFWSRWHISLSSWLKDYVYIPLGGNRKGKAKKYRNLLLTFLVSGLWHGAGFNFLFWGALHAIYQIVGECTRLMRDGLKNKIGIKQDSGLNKLISGIVTFHLVTFAWIFFRADSILSAFVYIRNMFSALSMGVLIASLKVAFSVTSLRALVARIGILGIHILSCLIIELRMPKQEDVIKGICRKHIIVRWIILLVLIFDVLLFGVYGSGYNIAGFMYGGF